MGTKYPGVSISGYNATPPSDDGSQTEANKVKWATIKSQLTDTLKTFAEAIDSALQTAFNYGPNTQATDYTVVAGDHNKTIQVTASLTITMISAATAGAGFTVRISNQHSAAITVNRSGSDVFNAAATSWSIPPYASVTFVVKAVANGFLVVDSAVNGNIGAATATSINFGGSTLSTYSESSYTATLTGCTTSPTYTVKYTKVGNVVTLQVPAATATSNSVNKTFTGAPSAVQPATQQRFRVLTCSDNGSSYSNTGILYIATDGVMSTTYYDETTWTSSGVWGVRAFTVSYTLA